MSVVLPIPPPASSPIPASVGNQTSRLKKQFSGSHNRLMIVFFAFLWVCPCLVAELTQRSKDVTDRLSAIEREERAKVRVPIAEKRLAVVRILKNQLNKESRAGNLDGASAIRDLIGVLENRELADLKATPTTGLPPGSQELFGKLVSFEGEEKKKLDVAIAGKRSAAIAALEKEVVAETKAGNLDGAKEIRELIVSIQNGEESVSKVDAPPLLGKKDIPKDAVRHRGHYYKIFEANESLTWKKAREKCRLVGGDLGWLDRDDDAKMLEKMMVPLVARLGHKPIWVGGRRNAAGVWEWLDGKEVDASFWAAKEHAISPAGNDYMIRWVDSFRASREKQSRLIGYLCRWE